jgi:carbonic anhydrase
MMERTLLTVAMLLVSSATFSAGTAHWGYSGEEGPDNWARLSPEYSACTGKDQSPVNLTGFIKAELKPITFDYSRDSLDILDNGHTVQIDVKPGDSITVDGTQFELKQFHFHAPSENLINGKSFPLEAHLVHADKDGNLAVVAVLFEEGQANTALEKAWAQMPQKEGDKFTLPAGISPLDILPANRDYYRFNGSLTTPPCSEGVRWLVMKHPMSVSKVQLAQFTHVMHHPNNRPVQAINARLVLEK